MGELTKKDLVEAHAQLAHMRPRADGTRCVPLAHFGAYEVRLCEAACKACGEIASIWIELYAHELKHVLESCGCHDADQAVAAANTLMLQAAQLHPDVPAAAP